LFLRNCNYNYNAIYICHGYILYKVETILHKFSLNITIIFPPSRDSLYTGRVKLFDEELKLWTFAVFLLVVVVVVVRKTASSG
jgi:hypothetical protein